MITSQEMKVLEEKSGIPRATLMENAGRKVAEILREKIGIKDKKILIVAFHGNNGGDGFVAARHLCDDVEIDILFLGDEEKLKNETLANFKKIENNGKIQFLGMDAVDFEGYDIVIDAIFGTGIEGKIEDPIASLISKMAESKAFKVSIDVPSGINPDTGEKSNVFFEPDLIITMHDIKKGLAAYKNKTVIADIGMRDKRQ